MVPYDQQYRTKANNDPMWTSLRFVDPRSEPFLPDEVIRGVAFVIHANEGQHLDLKGCYFGMGPVTHSNLRNWASSVTKYIPGPQNFDDKNYTHGFYTSMGRFLTRRDTMWLVEENNLPLAVDRSAVNYRDGLLSTDIWDCN